MPVFLSQQSQLVVQRLDLLLVMPDLSFDFLGELSVATGTLAEQLVEEHHAREVTLQLSVVASYAVFDEHRTMGYVVVEACDGVGRCTTMLFGRFGAILTGASAVRAT